ncbi:DNA-binding protein RFX8 [Suricata suricatta]|uniref:DNA-binding protein RFX8 n=1 Tax=Suricata suricatta TaxID=37032 RepID=UPI001155FCD7|nr:DNA-binding protein RFX8 [Suricata suricatta]
MAEDAPVSPAGGAGIRGLHRAVIQWLVDNFCICEGCSVPHCLMYEIYVETCGQNAQTQVNPSTFGKLVHLAFPDLGTRRRGTRGSARYHYDGICIKRSSFFYAQYCYLLGEKSGDTIAFEKSTNYNSIIQQEGTCENHSPMKTDPVGSPLSEFRRCPFWEQELAKKYSYKMMAFLADEYYNYCQDILQNVRNRELERVEDLLISFWKSLQQDTVMLMSLPDVCRLFKCYDVQLYKGVEDVLLHDFLEDVPIQYLKSVRLFSKKFKLWLLNALEGFPACVQISKLKEVTVFVKRLRRKTYLSNMAKTMRMVLKNNRRVSVLKSDLHAIINQGTLDTSENALPSSLCSTADLETHTEMQCKLPSAACIAGGGEEHSREHSSRASLTVRQATGAMAGFVLSKISAVTFIIMGVPLFHTIRLGNDKTAAMSQWLPPGSFYEAAAAGFCCLASQPSRNKEEFIKLAASFQLRWNFLLTTVSKVMTLCHRDSFGSWHLFHLLLLEYVIHILQSCIEEEEDDDDVGNLKEMLPDDQSLVQLDQAPFHPPDSSPAQEYDSSCVAPPRVTLKHIGQSRCPVGVNSVFLRVLGFLVDTATGDKLIQVLLEDKATESTLTLSLPVGQEAVVTLKDGQKFVIHVSDVP